MECLPLKTKRIEQAERLIQWMLPEANGSALFFGDDEKGRRRIRISRIGRKTKHGVASKDPVGF